MKDRDVIILDLLANNRRIKVGLLAELLNVSRVTLRRDLDNLEKSGMIQCTHGFANLNNADEPGIRLAFSYSVKRRIARAAAETVEDGETVLLESGSCCALFAKELALNSKNVTLITNSIFVVNHVRKIQNIKIILLGGFILPKLQVLVGPMTTKCAKIIFADKYFLGTDGFIPGQGFTGRDHLCIQTALGLAKHAKEVFILTESDKFHRRGAYNMIQLDKVSGVFTDDNIPKDAETALLKNNVLVYKVPAEEEKIR